MTTVVPVGTALNRASLVPTFTELFKTAPSLWTPTQPHKGVWKTNYFFSDPNGPSSRITPGGVVPDVTCMVDPIYLPGSYSMPNYSGQQYLLVKPTASTDKRLGGMKYTGGMLSLERTFTQTYGYFEVSLSVPRVAGCHPCFWLYSAPVTDLTGKQWDNGLGYGSQYTGGLNSEIDVAEFLTCYPNRVWQCASARNKWAGAVGDSAITPIQNGSRGTWIALSQPSHNWQTYGVMWDVNTLTFYINDRVSYSVANPGIHDPMYPLLTMGTGGWTHDNNLPATFAAVKGAALVVGFVKAYTVQ
jgi:beta-glucanase (GH16 family)